MRALYRLLPLILGALLPLATQAGDSKAPAKSPLIIVYGAYVTEPYIFLDKNQVVGGVYWDLAQLIEQQLARPVTFTRVPRRRMELYLAEGKAHVMLLAHPSWISNPQALEWTSPIMTEYDLLVQRKTHTFPVHSLDDLIGKRIGTILGYHYRGLSDEPYLSQVLRDDAKTIEANFKRLAKGRIDALLDSNILIEYFLRQQRMHDRFQLVTSWGIGYEIVSGLSPKSPVSAEALSQVYQDLHRTGAIEAVIEKYAPGHAQLVRQLNSP